MDEDIKYYLLLHGHKLDSINFELDYDLATYIEYILDNQKEVSFNNSIKCMNINQIINESSKYIDNIFNIHNVGHLDRVILDERVNNKEVFSIDEAINIYNNAKEEVSPYKLPIDYVNKHQYYGSLVIISPCIDEEIIIKGINVYFEKILLDKHLNRRLIPVYIHEIMHTQLESNKGVIKDIKNKEIISIFVELLYTYQNKDYKLFLSERLNGIIDDFNHICETIINKKDKGFKYITAVCYLVSAIQALKLLDTYINSNSLIRRELLIVIQNVFDNNISLEEALTKFDISYDSSKDTKVLKRLI